MSGARYTCYKSRLRRARGSQISEFAAALIVLLFFVFIPMLDLTILPFRWMLAQQCVNDYARRLALCETYSQSYRFLNREPSLRSKLEHLGGIQVSDTRLHLRVARVAGSCPGGEVLIEELPGQISSAWLPDGPKAPCSYSLILDVHVLISPAILVPAKMCSIPGLTAPVPLVLTASHEWENLARDPSSGKFFLNE